MGFCSPRTYCGAYRVYCLLWVLLTLELILVLIGFSVYCGVYEFYCLLEFIVVFMGFIAYVVLMGFSVYCGAYGVYCGAYGV